MDDIFTKILTQGSPLVVLVVVVWLFLKDASSSRMAMMASQANQRADTLDTLREIHEEHMEARLQARIIMEKMILAFETNSRALIEVTLELRTMNGNGRQK